MNDWWQWESSGPRRPAKDGIRARSQRGAIGESWWSKRFIAALEEIADPNRLRRGRSYARSGQVLDLRVEPGRVAAEVQGSRPSPYRVRVRVPPLTAEQWERVEEAMVAQALFLAALLAGEMPRDIEEAFTAAGLSLFPASAHELESECSCPDWANPCKHVAAVLYILAEAFDGDPFLILAWRGRAQGDLLASLRARRARLEPTTGPADEQGEPAGGMETAPLPASPAEFWRAGPELDGLRFHPRAAGVPEGLLAGLGAPAEVAGGERLAEALGEIYRVVTRGAERLAFPEEEGVGRRSRPIRRAAGSPPPAGGP